MPMFTKRFSAVKKRKKTLPGHFAPHTAGSVLKVFVVAGEVSGDILGAEVLRALKSRLSQTDCQKKTGFSTLEIQGIGGALMEYAGGFKSSVPLDRISVMGLGFLGRIFDFIKIFGRARRHIKAFNPHVVLTFDAPDFCLRIMKKVPVHIKRIHCVAPSVWAWRPGRAKKIAQFLDHLCVLFPFEPRCFRAHGLKTTCVGHPAAEKPIPPAQAFWNSAGGLGQSFASERTLLVLMPGSRLQEIKALWPVFLSVGLAAEKVIPRLTVAVLKAPGMHSFSDQPHHWLVLEGKEMHQKAMKDAACALAASGTATLELALLKCPMVVAYKTHWLLAWVMRRLIQTPFVSLPNIISGKKIVPEHLQKRCVPSVLLPDVLALLKQGKEFQKQKLALEKVRKSLIQEGGNVLSKGSKKNLQKGKGSQPVHSRFGEKVAAVVLDEVYS